MNNTQAKIFVGVTDHLDPELQAMLLAKYSRDYGSIVERLPTSPAEEQAIKNRLLQTYQTYGHRSVGQLGTTTIFFEGVSMLAAMAIVHGELFNGQESSTRYIPYSEQPAIDVGEPRVQMWQETWRAFYTKALSQTVLDLIQQYPMPEVANLATYTRTINARAFDICGGILPAGFTTSVGFSGTFDTLNDHLTWMAYHPLAEVRSIAQCAVQSLTEKYPHAGYNWEKILSYGQYLNTPHGAMSDAHIDNYYYRSGSFAHDAIYHVGHESNYDIRKAIMQQFSSNAAVDALMDKAYALTDTVEDSDHLSPLSLKVIGSYSPIHLTALFNQYRLTPILDELRYVGATTRKKYERFPKALSQALRFRISSWLDIRSYRDLHRHRNGNRPLPLLDVWNGLHPYYAANLNPELGQEFKALFIKQASEISGLYPGKGDSDKTPAASAEVHQARRALTQLNWQYAIPMAASVPYYYECDLNQLIYMLELRTDKTVHQTLRMEMMAAYDQLMLIFPDLKVHADLSSSNFTMKRGTQTYATTE